MEKSETILCRECDVQYLIRGINPPENQFFPQIFLSYSSWRRKRNLLWSTHHIWMVLYSCEVVNDVYWWKLMNIPCSWKVSISNDRCLCVILILSWYEKRTYILRNCKHNFSIDHSFQWGSSEIKALSMWPM